MAEDLRLTNTDHGRYNKEKLAYFFCHLLVFWVYWLFLVTLIMLTQVKYLDSQSNFGFEKGNMDLMSSGVEKTWDKAWYQNCDVSGACF